MVQTLCFVAISLTYALVVSVACMAIPGRMIGSLALCSVALGVLLYVKQWVSRPTFDTACNLTSIAIISCVVKEGSLNPGTVPWELLNSIFRIVTCGSLLSAAVCFFVCPRSAVSNLEKSLTQSCNTLAGLLKVIPSQFLRGGAHDEEIDALTKSLNKTLLEMTQALEEAKFETLFQRDRFKVYTKLVESSHSMARHMGGLRISAQMQKSVLQDSTVDPRKLFEIFVAHIGPSMRSFFFTLQEILKGVPNNSPKAYLHSLQLAREVFDRNHSEAVEELYRHEMFTHETGSSSSEESSREEMAAVCGNFASNLDRFAKALATFLEYVQILNEGGKVEETAKQAPKPPPLNTIDNPPTLGFYLWNLANKLRDVSVQFGVRVAFGVFVLSLPSVLPFTKQFFLHWHIEWSLIIFCIMMNKSVGGTNATVKWRLLGTFLGAFGAYVCWEISFGNRFVLAFLGWIISVVCFRILVLWKENNAFGRFLLLTFNLSALFSYSMMQRDKNEGKDAPVVALIAFHRFVSVSIGVAWAILLNVTFLPNSARGRLRKGLSVIWLRMGLIWNGDPLKQENNHLTGIENRHQLHEIMQELQPLLQHAPMEIRLKGLFPSKIYRGLLSKTSKVVDAFENLNSMIEVDMSISRNEHKVLEYVKKEKMELEHRIFLMFYMAASTIKLGFPIPGEPASAGNAKNRMLVKLSELRHSGIELRNQDFVLLYSYILVTSVLNEELQKIMHLLTKLFGLANEETLNL